MQCISSTSPGHQYDILFRFILINDNFVKFMEFYIMKQIVNTCELQMCLLHGDVNF